jgi:hypothetical protein
MEYEIFTNIINNLNTKHNDFIERNKNGRVCSVIDFYKFLTLKRNMKRYNKFIELFKLLDDGFLSVIRSNDINELILLRRHLKQYLFFLRRHEELRHKSYSNINEIRDYLTLIKNRETYKWGLLEEIETDSKELFFIQNLRMKIKRTKQLNLYNHFINVIPDNVLSFVMNKEYDYLLKFYRDLNEYLLLMRHTFKEEEI